MKRRGALALLTAVVCALALRVPKLDTRPLHNDEAVNAIKVSDLWERGRYAYDPDEYHGPALHYFTLPVLALSGAGSAAELEDAALRVAPVAFGTALILLLPLFSDGLGRHPTAWAALFVAISPAMVFYSRYFIHEMLLVFFTGLTLGAAWRYGRTRSVLWAATFGAGVGLMFATKETFVLALAAMVPAALGAHLWTRRDETGDGSESGLKGLLAIWNPRHAAVAFSTAFVIWLLLFSSFFSNPAGLLDSVRTYLPWLKRAGGDSPHIHPWSFYLQRLAWFHPAKGPVWSEGLILLLAAIGLGVSLVGRRSALRLFVALYTVLLTSIYSAISYKTPWCLLSFYFGMILLAGVGAAWLVERFRMRTVQAVVVVLLLGFGAQLAWQAWRAGVVYAADPKNPYVYAQTSPDLLNLVGRVEGIGRVAPAGFETVVKVVAPESDYWPLPWYLRRFKHVGWYDRLPDDPFAPIIIVSSELDARLDDRSERKWIMAGLTELRPRKFFELYVELELWKKFVETLPRNRESE